MEKLFKIKFLINSAKMCPCMILVSLSFPYAPVAFEPLY